MQRSAIALCLLLATVTPALAQSDGATESAESPVAESESAAGVNEAGGATIIVTGSASTLTPGEVSMTARAAEETAGVQGDALKAITTVGSVARNAGSSTGVSVWGAAPADTRIYVDDVPVPRLFHIGGSRSILPTSEIESFTLISGGAPARYGRGIGGAIVVHTAEPSWRDMDMRIRVDPIDVGGGFGARIGEHGEFSFAARSSIIAPVFAAIAPDRAGEAIAIPDYTDLQSRLSFTLPDGQELRVLGLFSIDVLSRGIPQRIAAESVREESSAGFGRLGLSIKRARGNRSRKLVFWLGRDEERTILRFPGAQAETTQRTNALGMLLEAGAELSKSFKANVGIDSELSQSRWSRDGAVSLPAREGDITVFGQPPGNRVNRDSWSVTRASVGLYSTAAWTLFPGLTFEPGLRLEPSVISGDRVLPVRPTEPRVGYSEIRWQLSPRTKLTYEVFRDVLTVYMAGGQYAQAPSSGDLSPVFGSPVLEPATAWQVLSGVRISPWDRLDLGLEGFLSRQRGLTVRTPDPTPAIANLLESTGKGRSLGLQLSVNARLTPRLRAEANYTFMEADRRAPDQQWRAFDLDQEHTLRSALAWSSPSGITLAGRVEITSGFPRTSVVGAVFNVASQEFDPIWGRQNASNLPAFAELSLRASYEGLFADGSYRVWLDVVNATNRENALERYYSPDYSRQSQVRGFPLLPLIGAEIRL